MRAKNTGITETFTGRGRMTALAVTIEREALELLPRLLQKEPAKVIAFKAGARSPRTAENWQNGVNIPQVPAFLALANQIPELKAKVLEWLGAKGEEGARDDSERVLHEIQTLLQKRMG